MTRDQWHALAPTFRDYNYRHMWDYGRALADRHGARCEHVAIERSGSVIGIADVRIKTTPLIGGGIAYVSGGPLTRREGSADPRDCRDSLAGLVETFCRQRGYLLRVLPPLGSPEANQHVAASFVELGFHVTERAAAYRTMVVDLRRPLKDIRSSLAQKWRNGLNGAERKGLVVRGGADDGTFGEFCALFDDFNKRKGFHVELDAAFFRELQRRLPASDQLITAVVESEGKVVAGHVSSSLGDTCVYLLGATNEEGLKAKAAYLLQWNAIAQSHARGLDWYDLGGIDPEENPTVYHFKAGMNGADVTAPGPYELAGSALRSALTLKAELVYRAIRKRKGAHAG